MHGYDGVKHSLLSFHAVLYRKKDRFYADLCETSREKQHKNEKKLDNYSA